MEYLYTEKYDPAAAASLGNRFFIGNGLMGVRGCVDEAGPDQLAAVNLAGVYDGIRGKWREPVNAPNPFYGCLMVDDEVMEVNKDVQCETELTLDISLGEFRRTSLFRTDRGTVKFIASRFVSMKDRNLGAQRYSITADFHADIRLMCGIDMNIWDINGPHLTDMEASEEHADDGQTYLTVQARTQEKGHRVRVTACMKPDFPCQESVIHKDGRLLYEFNFVSDTGREYILSKIVSVEAELNTDDTVRSSDLFGNRPYLMDLCGSCEGMNSLYVGLREDSLKVWGEIWKRSRVVIEGDSRAQSALDYSIYQMYAIAPCENSGLSIPARGLSGQTYKGAVFWDTEIFMMDLFINTAPKIARELVMYRIKGLEGARRKAREYGYRGAFYAWESQEDGTDACSDHNVTDVFTGRPMRTYFRDKQVHISAAVCYALKAYVEATGDTSVLDEGGREMAAECAEFYLSLLWQHPFSEEYEIRDVIGPDEYHERVDNNAYTNEMARFVLEYALEMAETGERAGSIKERDGYLCRLRLAIKRLKAKQPDERGIIEQFDGYFDLEDTIPGELVGRLKDPKEYWGGAYGVASETGVIKQADVIALMALRPELFSEDIKRRNWEYYEPRTEHGSSLSACMYGLTACECGLVSRAYDMFLRSAEADLGGSGKEWAGLVYIGGIHPAAHGGAYMLAVRGFAGMKREGGRLSFTPHLPDGWTAMEFSVCDHGEWRNIRIGGNRAKEKTSQPV